MCRLRCYRDPHSVPDYSLGLLGLPHAQQEKNEKAAGSLLDRTSGACRHLSAPRTFESVHATPSGSPPRCPASAAHGWFVRRTSLTLRSWMSARCWNAANARRELTGACRDRLGVGRRRLLASDNAHASTDESAAAAPATSALAQLQPQRLRLPPAQGLRWPQTNLGV